MRGHDICNDSPNTGYFQNNPPPPSLESCKAQASAFIADQINAGRKVALVTSGGTTVPLEEHTVRFIDNFSAGTRGATSTEYLLQAGYAVIFLHRQFSLLPYSRHYSHSTNCFLDYMEPGPNGTVVVSERYQEQMHSVLQRYSAVRNDERLLLLPFTTITEYLWDLRAIAVLMRPLGPRALFYLAAAVSDFFLPKDKIAVHKIQSSDNAYSSLDNAANRPQHSRRLLIDLDPVPKFLKDLIDGWAPEGMIVSFKLETDPSLLVAKAQQALARYSHHLVIGNLLSTRKEEVVFVSPGTDEKWIRVPWHKRGMNGSDTTADARGAPGISSGDRPIPEQPQHDPDIEIESLIVPEVIEMHRNFVRASQKRSEEDEDDLLQKALAWAEFGGPD